MNTWRVNSTYDTWLRKSAKIANVTPVHFVDEYENENEYYHENDWFVHGRRACIDCRPP